MGKMQRTKGSAYERFVANRLREVYPGAKRGIGQARSACEVSDVDGTPFWVECKHQKQPNLFAALEQATEAMTEYRRLDEHREAFPRPPLVVARRNRERDVAVLYLDDFLQLVRDLENHRKACAHWNEKYHALLSQAEGS